MLDDEDRTEAMAVLLNPSRATTDHNFAKSWADFLARSFKYMDDDLREEFVRRYSSEAL